MADAAKKNYDIESEEIPQKHKPITFAEFYETVEDNVKADLLDGRIIRDSPAVPEHARIVTWITRLPGNYVEHFGIGEVPGATTTVRLSQYQAPEPDVFFIRKSRESIIREKYIDGPPDLCVEVVSNSRRE